VSTTAHTNAADRFLCNYDEDGRNVALIDADAYCKQRAVDALALRNEMQWRITTDGVMHCTIYGHSILLAFKDGKLHPGFKAGNCEMHHTSWSDVEVVVDIKQVVGSGFSVEASGLT
jgi:hypothetical protein